MLKTKLSADTLVLATALTDHNSLALSISTRYRLSPAKLINRINHTSLSADLKVSIDYLYTLNDANLAENFFIASIQTLIRHNSKDIKISSRKRLLKPWISSAILKCLENRDKNLQKLKKEPNNEIL